MISGNVEIGNLLKRLRKVPMEAPRIIKKAIDTDARGFVRDIVGLTPPSNKTANKASHERGKMAITSDLLGLKGSRDKHQRTAGVFVVMSDDLLANNARQSPNGSSVRLFVKKDGTVYACDRRFFRPRASNGEMYAHHQSMRTKRGRVTTAGGATRDIGRTRFIDQMVVSRSAYLRYEKWIHKRVGMLAAGYNAAAQKLGVKMPAWIKKHGTKGGRIDPQTTQTGYFIEITNSVPYNNEALPRQIKFVLDSEKRKKRIANVIKYEIAAVLKRQRLT